MMYDFEYAFGINMKAGKGLHNLGTLTRCWGTLFSKIDEAEAPHLAPGEGRLTVISI